MSKVLVLGCGPAGLIAAHTAEMLGADVTIYSRKIPSPIYGAQWIQEPIPEVTTKNPDGEIQFVMLGTREGYAEKLYGDPMRDSGWTDHLAEPVKPGWDIRAAYQWLYHRFEPFIIEKELDAEEMRRIEWDSWDYIFNCVPLWNICENYREGHVFEKYKVLIQPSHPAEQNINRIIYNGRKEDQWFRSSQVFGVDGGYEYPIDANVENATMVRKPLRTNCNCWMPRVIRIGRYGAWDMNGLVHDGFHVVKEAMEKGR